MTAHADATEHVYLAWDLSPWAAPGVPDDEHDLDTIAARYGGTCCGGGTWFAGGERERDYEFVDVRLGSVAEFADAVRAEYPGVRVRLGES